jgi:hypothetical protein
LRSDSHSLYLLSLTPLILQRLNYLQGTSGGSSETKDNAASYSRIGTSGNEKQDADGNIMASSSNNDDSVKKLSAEALQKEEDDFSKMEDLFITELGLMSTELPSYAKAKGVDVALPPEPEQRSGMSKGRN